MPNMSEGGDAKNQDCTIIILSYNTKEVTDTCLAHAEAAVAYCQKQLNNNVKIVSVDNGSKDGTVEMIKQTHPSTQLIALEQNVGYPKGNNIAMKDAATPFILLLNSDAYLREDTLVKALDYMHSNNQCDALCIKLVYPDGGFQPYGGYLPNPFRTIRWTFGLESLPILKHYIKPIYQYEQSFFAMEHPMEWCSTGFFLMRKKVYDLTGGFDENLFLYMEDVEWCQRIHEKQLRIFYTPNIDIVHLGGFTSKKLPSKELLQRHIEGVKYFHKKHYPNSLGLVTWAVKTGMWMRATFYTLAGKHEKAEPYKAVLATL